MLVSQATTAGDNRERRLADGEGTQITTEEILVEAKEEVKEAPSRLRKKLRELEDLWERTTVQFFQSPKN